MIDVTSCVVLRSRTARGCHETAMVTFTPTFPGPGHLVQTTSSLPTSPVRITASIATSFETPLTVANLWLCRNPPFLCARGLLAASPESIFTPQHRIRLGPGACPLSRPIRASNLLTV